MQNSPIIKPSTSNFDRILRLISYAFFALLWGATLYAWYSLPETIPVHFNFKGEIDRQGSKNNLLILPLLGSFIFIIISLLVRYPHKFNYTVPITEENAAKQYANAILMMRWLLAAVMIILFSLVLGTILIVQKIDINISYLLLPLILGLLSLPMLIFIIRSFKLK